MRREALYMVPRQLGINDRFDARGPRSESMSTLRQYVGDIQTIQGNTCLFCELIWGLTSQCMQNHVVYPASKEQAQGCQNL
jgi:hypothetical protein